MLKHHLFNISMNFAQPAAFRRLCVETHQYTDGQRHVVHLQPPSGGCVLKHHLNHHHYHQHYQPPSGGCVLKR